MSLAYVRADGATWLSPALSWLQLRCAQGLFAGVERHGGERLSQHTLVVFGFVCACYV